MSLKPVEMQIAIPRTNEATSVQNQLNHKPALDQAALADLASRRTDQQRAKSAEVDASAFLAVKDEGKESGDREGGAGSGRKPKKQPSDPGAAHGGGHPFKGKHIDISL